MFRVRACMRAGFLALFLSISIGCAERTLLADIPGDEARRCSIVLQARDLAVRIDRVGEGNSPRYSLVLMGDDAEYQTAVRILDAHGLPKGEPQGFSNEAGSLIPSPAEEHARFLKGLSGEIETLIENIDGIASAEVVVSVPERRPLAGDTDAAASASTVISFIGHQPPITLEEVQALVVQSVGSSIAPERVTVVFKPSVRADVPTPIIQFERDRVVEAGFLAAVGVLASLEVATVWMMRARRRSAETATKGDG